MLAEVLDVLQCPLCCESLEMLGGSLRCARGHSHDIARQGYVSLFPPRGRTHPGDTAEMVAARQAFLAAGYLDPIADAVADAALEALGRQRSEHGCVVDLGAGTGYYLAWLLDRLPGWRGLALDASRPALRRAARAHERIGAVGCDAWSRLPVRSDAAELALSVFAPRNAKEMRRVLTPGGALVAVTPKPHHLEPLASRVGLLSVERDKRERLLERLAPHFRPEQSREVDLGLALSRAEASMLVEMGPSAHHLSADDVERRLSASREPLEVRVSVTVDTLRKRASW
ncbi:MAG: putative RNA methyltransferase [Actinomycetota bacterium]